MKKAGMIIFLIGAVLLVLAGLYFFFISFLSDPQVPLLIRLPVGLVVLGLLLVMVGIIADRMREKDRYREVER